MIANLLAEDIPYREVFIVPVKYSGLNKEEALPVYARPGDAGCDVKASLDKVVCISPGEVRLIPTGISVAISNGFEIQVRPRSGLALKHQVTVLNSPGTIDSSFRGEIGVILINHGRHDFIVEPGMRIAQLVLSRYETISWAPVEVLPETERGADGFGSSGI